MKSILLILLVTTALHCYGQLRCVDVAERIEPSPHSLLNNSIGNLLNQSQIERLKKEQNLIFSLKFDLHTGSITHLQMDRTA